MLTIPSVRLPAPDWTRLMLLVFDSESECHPAALFLRNEVHRAIVVDNNECAKDIVCLNNWVTYVVDWQASETCVNAEEVHAMKLGGPRAGASFVAQRGR
jgi:hypothetical protein